MKRNRLIVSVLAGILLVLPVILFPSGTGAQSSLRPMELSDITAWKVMRSAVVSNDGQWFAYRVGTREGDGEVVVRRTADSKELRFPAGGGSAGARGGGRGGAAADGTQAREIAFSPDSKWVEFTIMPPARTAGRGRGTGSTPTPGRGGQTQDTATAQAARQNKVALLNLASEKKVEFERIRRAVFSGENPN